MVNVCKNGLRKRNETILIDSNEEEEYFEDYQREETRHDVFTYLKKLNIHQQEAIKLKYFLDMDYATILWKEVCGI
ncbi:sigma-70 RNA polymerase sigma factor region 4 domain-containing protein [Acetivibrio cellulolyticus]|uniref:sigma-70 family RNA polymerase sigma factor n=1 Tax=Acetivibrio cellulolyticus TaxID=35830 RepID=UPI0001E2CC41|nr:sigma-70 family RNA polymerase sigma factor [Acetivibrio cellulolyticus]